MTCDPRLVSCENSPNIAKSNRIFPGKGRGDKSLILTYLDNLNGWSFSALLLIFFYFGHLQEGTRVQIGPKVLNLDPSLFHKNSDLSKNFQIMVLFARVLPLIRISAILDHIWGNKGPKTSQKGLFCEFWIGTQNFEIF